MNTNEIIYKKITFQVDETTFNLIQEVAKNQYLSMSAFIRRAVDKALSQEVLNNG